MDTLSQLLPILLYSAALQGVFLMWRRLSHTWDSWFPPFQKAAKAVLWLAVGGFSVLLIIALLGSTAQPGLRVLALAIGLGTFAIFKKYVAMQSPKDRTERGAVIASPQEVKGQVRAHAKRTGESADLVLGGVPIPKDAEPYHFLVSGSTGSGKSVAIRGMLDVLRARNDTVILVDSGGEFMSKYWDENRDVVLNPFDARCAPWSPLAEIEGPWDTGALARSIVPDGTGETKEWNSYAQTFLSSCMQALSTQGRTKLSDLLWAVQQATMKELQPLLAGTPAASQLGSEKTFGSIRTIAGNYMASYNYLGDNEEDAFSVSQFVKHARGNFLYLTYRDDQLDSIRHMLSCILDIAARAILSLQPDSNRRVWLIIDEFASIGKVQSIEAVATKARKVGGCLVIGIQSIAQLKDRYGEHQAQSILSCLSNALTLRCSDGDTAELMSRNLGEAEVVRTSAGSSTSDSGVDSRSWNEQKTTQRLVLPSQLQQLKNLQGFLKISGSFPVCEIKLIPPKNRETVTPAFEGRDFRAKPLMGMSGTAEAAKPEAPGRSVPEKSPVPNTASKEPSTLRNSAERGLQSNAVAAVAPVAPITAAQERPALEPQAPAQASPVQHQPPRSEIVVTLRPRKPSTVTSTVAAPVQPSPPSTQAAAAVLTTPAPDAFSSAPKGPVIDVGLAATRSQKPPAPVEKPRERAPAPAVSMPSVAAVVGHGLQNAVKPTLNLGSTRNTKQPSTSTGDAVVTSAKPNREKAEERKQVQARVAPASAPAEALSVSEGSISPARESREPSRRQRGGRAR